MPRPVWRRVEVPTEIYLNEFHLVIQYVMGWENYHLYHFRLGCDTFFSELNPDDAFGAIPTGKERSASETTLAALCQQLPRSMKFGYTYDFGDNWGHTITVEAIEQADPNAIYPRLLKAVRRCPPEDCGGPWGYADYLRAIADPDHEQREELLEGGEPAFDPERVETKALQAAIGLLAANFRRAGRGGRKPKG